MAVSVYSYTIYHSPNAYLGTVLPRRAIAELPEVELVRRPIYVPRERGLMIAELLGGKENRNAGSYNREDCRRRLDVNEPATIVWAAGRAGLDPEVLMMELAGPSLADGCGPPSPSSSGCNAPAYRPSSSTASASSARTGSIGSPISAAQEAEDRVIEPS
jgi:2-hydroxychromene-2-carboxylate isomerase